MSLTLGSGVPPVHDAAFPGLAERVCRSMIGPQERYPLVVLAGPGGAGKTLRAQHLVRTVPPGRSVAWLSDDELRGAIIQAGRAGDFTTVASDLGAASLVVLDGLSTRGRPATNDAICDLLGDLRSRVAAIVTTSDPFTVNALRAPMRSQPVILEFIPRLSPSQRQRVLESCLVDAGLTDLVPARLTGWLSAYLPDDGFQIKGFVLRLHLELTCRPGADPTDVVMAALRGTAEIPFGSSAPQPTRPPWQM
jgi:hypothetical protein